MNKSIRVINKRRRSGKTPKGTPIFKGKAKEEKPLKIWRKSGII